MAKRSFSARTWLARAFKSRTWSAGAAAEAGGDKRTFKARTFLARAFASLTWQSEAEEDDPTPATASLLLTLPAELTLAYTAPFPVFFEEGWLASGVEPQVTKDGVVIPSQFLLDVSWADDDSAQSGFIYFNADPDGSVYRLWNGFVDDMPAPDDPIQSEITITPYFTDHNSNVYSAVNTSTTTIENGSLCKTVKYSGEMSRLGTSVLSYDIWVDYYAHRISFRGGYCFLTNWSGLKAKKLGVLCTPPSGFEPWLMDDGSRNPQAILGPTLGVYDMSFWPDGGPGAIPAITSANWHRWEWFSKGEFLDPNTPTATGAGTAITEGTTLINADHGAPTEVKPAQMTSANMQGVHIAAGWAFRDPAVYTVTATADTLFQNNPVDVQRPQDIADSLALGPLVPIGTGTTQGVDIGEMWDSLQEIAETFFDPDYFGFNQWHNYGNMPESKISLGGGNWRPAQHRPCSYNHYPMRGWWLMVFMGGGQDLLNRIRKASQYLREFGQPDVATGVTNKKVGGFIHSITVYPWATSTPGLEQGEECEYLHHGSRPNTLLLHWRHDRDYLAKQGWELFYANADFGALAGTSRESNTTLVAGVYAKRYKQANWSAGNEADLVTIAETLIATPISGHSERLFNPEWPVLAHEVLNTPASLAYISSASALIIANGLAWSHGTSLPKGENDAGITAAAVHGYVQDYSLDIPAAYHFSDYLAANFIYGPGPLGSRHLEIAFFFWLAYLDDPEIDTGMIVNSFPVLRSEPAGLSVIGGNVHNFPVLRAQVEAR